MHLSREVPEDLQPSLAHTDAIVRSFLFALQFTVFDTGRDPEYVENHLLSYLAQDYLQSTVSLPMMAREGVHNVCLRELRFILEMSLKLCFVQQNAYGVSVANKLTQFKSTLNSPSITVKNSVALDRLPAHTHDDFNEDVGRIYGQTSNYVHLTQTQILERISLISNGKTAGYESADDVDRMNRLIGRGLAVSLVYLFHAVPQYVVGDLLVQSDGGLLDWEFARSKWIAYIDEEMDYKHERQEGLQQIRTERWARVEY